MLESLTNFLAFVAPLKSSKDFPSQTARIDIVPVRLNLVELCIRRCLEVLLKSVNSNNIR